MLPGVTVRLLCSFSRIMWLSPKPLAYLGFTPTASHSRPGPMPGSRCQHKMKIDGIAGGSLYHKAVTGLFKSFCFDFTGPFFVYIMASSFVFVKDSRVCGHVSLHVHVYLCFFCGSVFGLFVLS